VEDEFTIVVHTFCKGCSPSSEITVLIDFGYAAVADNSQSASVIIPCTSHKVDIVIVPSSKSGTPSCEVAVLVENNFAIG
jgi:hypothetical protein